MLLWTFHGCLPGHTVGFQWLYGVKRGGSEEGSERMFWKGLGVLG